MHLTKKFFQHIPKSELHLHLRGAMTPGVFSDLLKKYSVDDILKEIPEWRIRDFLKYSNIRRFLYSNNWSLEGVADLFSLPNIYQFLATYGFLGYFIRDVSDLRKLMFGVIENLKRQNVVYAEITISLVGYLERGISLEEIKVCLEEVEVVEGIRVQWIVDLLRDTGGDAAMKLLEKILELDCKSIVGITLGGTENHYPTTDFAAVYSVARENGLHLTIHAGEIMGAQSVWQALGLGVERIGHGVRSIEDKNLVNYLAMNKIPLEVCPTSNIKTGIFPSYEAHPVKPLIDAGVTVTLNTDDPTFFRTTIADEYARVHSLGVPADKMLEVLKNGFNCAFLPKEEKKFYLGTLEREWQEDRIKPIYQFYKEPVRDAVF